MPMSTVATKERGSRSPKRRAKSSASRGTPKAESKAEQKAAAPAGDRRIGQGGHRLAAAFDTVSALPALAESRRRLLAATNGAAASGDELADTIESDAGLAIQVMRAANNGGGPHGRTRGIREAVDVLTVDRLRRIAEHDGHLRPVRAPRLALGAARALPPPRGRHALRGRSHRRARSAGGSRRAGCRRPSSRRRQAGAGGASQRVLGHRRARTRRRTSGSAASVASSASTTRWSGRSWFAAGRCRRTSPRRSSGTTRRRPPATQRRSGSRTWSSTTRAATR